MRRACWGLSPRRAVFGALLLVAGLLLPPPAAADLVIGIVAEDAADPDVFTAGGRHWLFTTNVFPYGMTINVPVRVSDDLLTWYYVGDALPELGAWARPGKTWAPSIVAVDGGYLLHYVATERTTWRQCVGVATSATPYGPFVDVRGEPLVCDISAGGSIDPDVFVTDDGRLVLHWKSDGNAIRTATTLWARELTSSGTAFAPGSVPNVLLSSHGGPSWELGVIENPAMVAGGDGSLWLLYSGGLWESDRYAVGTARCAGALGPCERSEPLVSTGSSVTGPGGASVFTDNAGALWLAVHAWVGAPSYRAGGERWTALLRVEVDRAGVRFRVDPPAATPGPAPVRASRCGAVADDVVAASIARLYRAYFARVPDADGAAYWLALHLDGRACLADISEYFASSSEFVDTYGTLGIPDFVRLAYLNVLGREPDPDGYTHWASHLAAGLPRGVFLIGFSESPEFRARTGIA